MRVCIKNVNIFHNGAFIAGGMLLENGVVSEIFKGDKAFPGAELPTFDNCFVFPGFADVHVHLREPGFSYKEGIKSGTLAAAAGGFTKVCAMPNLSPVPDCLENLRPQLDAIGRDAAVRVLPYGALTRGEKGAEPADMAALAPYVAAFSDDGKGVQSGELMERAMREARRLGKLIAAHCEDESLLHGGCVHEGEYARAHGLGGISSESEWRQVERDIALVEKTGCAYHVCHVSTARSVELIRSAKARGLDVTCETAPHYLLLNDSMLQDEGRFKMNPPIRAEEDRQALIAGLLDGTVDMIATDHAPHSPEEKAGGLKNSLNGVSGLETAFPVLYTGLVLPGIITLERLVELMHTSPCRRFGLKGGLSPGQPADFTVFDLNAKYAINASRFVSRGKSSPFDGREVFGKCLLTYADGKIAWEEKQNA